ncbi:hypothetical protein K438DRAFT_962014 [Mycena galopus ATCC 62051]|nr:hypothetical protein K438DRAFT_962014 [Mycena galopus ATCC 62051]
MDVNCAMDPLKVQARVLEPSMLNYGPGFRQLPITPGDGACNMVEKKFFKAVANEHGVVVVYEQQRRFDDQSAQDAWRPLPRRRDIYRHVCLNFALINLFLVSGINLAPVPFVDIDRWRSRMQPGPPPHRPEAHHLLS